MSHIEFDRAVTKGVRFFNLLETTSDSQQGVVFSDYTDLALYGYIQEDAPEPFSLQPLQNCLQSLGVSHTLDIDGGLNSRIYHSHSKETRVNNLEYPATGAYFIQIINKSQGVLIAASNKTAANIALEDWPPLHHWSDIAYLQTLAPSLASSTPNTILPPTVSPPINPRFIIRYCCQNPTTNAVVNYILSSLSSSQRQILPEWPGLSFPVEPACREGMALLGTPNGAGVAWLLAGRKESWGEKRVRQVTVFYAADERDIFRWPSLVFWVGGEGDS